METARGETIFNTWISEQVFKFIFQSRQKDLLIQKKAKCFNANKAIYIYIWDYAKYEPCLFTKLVEFVHHYCS